MARTRKIFVILAVVCFSLSAAAASQLIGTTNGSMSYVSPTAALCTLDHHFRFRKMVPEFALHALVTPLRIDPCGAAP